MLHKLSRLAEVHNIAVVVTKFIICENSNTPLYNHRIAIYFRITNEMNIQLNPLYSKFLVMLRVLM